MNAPTSPARLASAAFRREREATWRELEELLERAEARGLSALSTRERMALPQLYRAALSSLSIAREISLDANLTAYLESLCLRAHLFVYAVRETFGQALADILVRAIPRAVRAIAPHVLVAGLVFALAGCLGFALVSASSEWYYAFVPEYLAGGRDPSASTAYLRGTLFDGAGANAERLATFAMVLFVHNTGVGLFAFALGFMLGLPTLALLIYNGLILGAFVALFASRGLGVEAAGWLTIHGATELFAVILCGGAGLKLAEAVLFPGARTRLAGLAERGRAAGLAALGAAPLFLLAGLLEGFGRQLITDTGARFLIGASVLTAVLAYLALSGRETR